MFNVWPREGNGVDERRGELAEVQTTADSIDIFYSGIEFLYKDLPNRSGRMG